MAQIKALEFLGSDEELKIIEDIRNLLKIDWGNEKASGIFSLTENILRYNQTSETSIKELIKKWLDFLNEDEINNLYQFLAENFLPKVRELWQEEDKKNEEDEENEEIQKNKEVQKNKESFEEKEKKYIELMKNIVQPPQSQKEKPKEEKKEAEEYKTITFEPKEEHEEKILTESLPKDAIIITKKKEDEQKKEGEEFLDLSKL